MLLLKYVSALCLAVSVSAQGRFNGPENSAAVLRSLQTADATTITSGTAAQAYNAADSKSVANLVYQNQVLLGNYNAVRYVAQSSAGFYTDAGAQAIIDFVNNKLYPDTLFANNIYRAQRNAFIAGGFNNFINPGLLQLRQAVDSASAAVQARTRANKLTPITEAFLKVVQEYADVQEFQQNGPR